MPKTLLAALATGYIFVYYSEHLFWAHPRAGDNLIGFSLAWLLYALLAFVFLSLINHFRVRSLWALFLCGALFGWLAEGVVVQTTYELLPLSISFTGLSWHALFTVWVGWYAVRKALHTAFGAVLRLSIIIGVIYGLWAVWWWAEPGDIVATPLAFAAYSFITTLLVILAYAIADRTTARFTAPRWSKWLVGSLLLAYFIIITIPTTPIALLVLPPLLAVCYFTLRHNHRIETRDSLLSFPTSAPPPKRYIALLALPLAASLIYALVYQQGWLLPTNQIVYFITMPLGFLLFCISVYKGLRPPKPIQNKP